MRLLQAKVNRGRVVLLKVLKQPVHKPLPVEKQVIFSVRLTHGFLDTISVDDIVSLKENSMPSLITSEIWETIRETKDLPEEAVLDATITEFLNQSSFQ